MGDESPPAPALSLAPASSPESDDDSGFRTQEYKGQKYLQRFNKSLDKSSPRRSKAKEFFEKAVETQVASKTRRGSSVAVKDLPKVAKLQQKVQGGNANASETTEFFEATKELRQKANR